LCEELHQSEVRPREPPEVPLFDQQWEPADAALVARFEAAVVHPEVHLQVVRVMFEVAVDAAFLVAAAVGDDRWAGAPGHKVRRCRGSLGHYIVMVLGCGLTGWRGETLKSPFAMSSSTSSSMIRYPSPTGVIAPSVTKRLRRAVTVSRLVPMVCARFLRGTARCHAHSCI